MWTILGGDVGMPMVIFVCAEAAEGSVSAAAAIRARVGQSLCISSSQIIFYMTPRALTVARRPRDFRFSMHFARS